MGTQDIEDLDRYDRLAQAPETNRWKEIRKRLGLTQETLALLLGVHPITVSCWERGKSSPNPWCAGLMEQFATIPDPEAVGRLAQARLVTDGLARALYELLKESDAGRKVREQL